MIRHKQFTTTSGLVVAVHSKDGNTWELPCQKCGELLFGSIPLDITLRQGESVEDGVKRLLIGWAECNGNPNEIHCQDCREKGKVTT